MAQERHKVPAHKVPYHKGPAHYGPANKSRCSRRDASSAIRVHLRKNTYTFICIWYVFIYICIFSCSYAYIYIFIYIRCFLICFVAGNPWGFVPYLESRKVPAHKFPAHKGPAHNGPAQRTAARGEMHTALIVSGYVSYIIYVMSIQVKIHMYMKIHLYVYVFIYMHLHIHMHIYIFIWQFQSGNELGNEFSVRLSLSLKQNKTKSYGSFCFVLMKGN